jgi:diguanylate cyclase (GGDEF)-like protein
MMFSINKNEPYTILYCDIDNFKVYNDIYGFENGDLIIKMLANVLFENIILVIL